MSVVHICIFSESNFKNRMKKHGRMNEFLALAMEQAVLSTRFIAPLVSSNSGLSSILFLSQYIFSLFLLIAIQ